MGTEGIKASLISREVIADSIELVGRGHMFDAIVALDKTIPAAAMALYSNPADKCRQGLARDAMNR